MKLPPFVNQFAMFLSGELAKGRISPKFSALTILPTIVIYVWIYTHQTPAFAMPAILSVLTALFIVTMIFIGLETVKPHNIPNSVLIAIGLGLSIVATIAMLTTTQGEVVRIFAMKYMIFFGALGLCVALIGLRSDKNDKPKKIIQSL